MKKICFLLKNKYFYYIISILLMLILSVYDFKYKLEERGFFGRRYLALLLLVGLFISIIFFLVVYFKDKRKISLDKLFPVVALVFGFMYIVGSPLFTGSDEHNHYYRIYEITEGVFVTPVVSDKTIGSELPISLYKTFNDGSDTVYTRNTHIKYIHELDMMKVKLKRNEKTQYGINYIKEYNNTALYSPIQYFPQIIGFLIGKVFDLGPFWIGELGRVFNLLFYVIICSYFLRKLVKLKLFAFLVLLCPNMLSNAATLSADAFTCALIFGFLTMILSYINGDNKKITNSNMIIFLVLSIFISTCKIVYFPFIMLLLLIPNRCFKSKRVKFIFVGCCIILSAIVGGSWLSITDKFFDAYYVNSSIQKKNILGNIIWYFFVVFRTYLTRIDMLILNFFGGNNMYHSQLEVYKFISIAYFVLVFISYFVKDKDNKKDNIKSSYYLFIVIVMLMVLALITTAIYVQCTANFVKIDNMLVAGLQGRYYIPLILCLILLKGKNNIINVNNSSIFTDLCMIINVFILFQMIVCFSV